MEQDGKELIIFEEQWQEPKDIPDTSTIRNRMDAMERVMSKVMGRLEKIEMMLTEIGRRTIDGSSW